MRLLTMIPIAVLVGCATKAKIERFADSGTKAAEEITEFVHGVQPATSNLVLFTAELPGLGRDLRATLQTATFATSNLTMVVIRQDSNVTARLNELADLLWIAQGTVETYRVPQWVWPGVTTLAGGVLAAMRYGYRQRLKFSAVAHAVDQMGLSDGAKEQMGALQKRFSPRIQAEIDLELDKLRSQRKVG